MKYNRFDCADPAEHEDHLWDHDEQGQRYYCPGRELVTINRMWSRERQEAAEARERQSWNS